MVSAHKSKEELGSGNGGANLEEGREEAHTSTGKDGASNEGKSPEIQALEIKVKEEKEKAEELKGLLQRVQAEFENYMKRSNEERKGIEEIANVKLIREFLPLMDSFHAAMEKLGKKHESSRDALEGISLLKKQLGQIMGRHGIQEMKSPGNKFDPEKHDCLMFENHKDREDGIVLEEIQKGYIMRGKIIRHAKVKVNRKN